MTLEHTVVRYTVKPGLEGRNADLVGAVYRELEEAAPAGFHYATFRLEGGRVFVHVASDDGDGDFPLTGLPAFREFREGLEDRCEEGPIVSRAEKIGGYRSVGM